ncbi:hypothetical protein A3D11_03055 [Candidatus Peribacteria bacterium RIFCSPHIGHO2_02_FULL_49_16]|nr:MAG: hypothetical protein A2880_01505 [Candidatus Peribacteria bacterium RIFCSPHIGHO2_01_FULL_49_38]OGJ58561.1 MAG: hypothetical protein A3D11_03055 [Candidatus Peribacteria bacterium RIFCSPHIGHO2_02_FULL_49_16]
MKKPCIGVLGAGAIGQLIVTDLLQTFDGSIVVMGRHLSTMKKKFPASKNLHFRRADVQKTETLAKALRGIDLVIHAVHHEYNEAVMRACLKTKTHYLDLGGLYHYTLKQFAFHARFRRANLVAVLGMGAAPGITNILASYGACEFDRVDHVEIRIGVFDQSVYRKISPLAVSYSLQTLLEECSWPSAVWKNNTMTFVDPMSGRESYKFPAPVGWQKPQYTIHSELATLPKTLHAKNVFFKIAFPDILVENIQILRSVGLLDEKNLKTTMAILKKLPPSIPETFEQYEIIQVIVRGMRHRKKSSVRLEVHVPTLGEMIEKDTAAPASIVAQMVVRGEWITSGVFPPELIVPIELFFQELAHRGMSVRKNGRKIF